MAGLTPQGGSFRGRDRGLDFGPGLQCNRSRRDRGAAALRHTFSAWAERASLPDPGVRVDHGPRAACFDFAPRPLRCMPCMACGGSPDRDRHGAAWALDKCSGALSRYTNTAPGRAGARRLRFLAALAVPAESPMETRLRWLLFLRGLPRPDLQTNLYDSENRFAGRADLYYPAARLVLEYDGAHHRDRLVEDNRRQNRLLNAGFGLLRFTAADIHNQPQVVEAQVQSARAERTKSTPQAPRTHQEPAASRSTSVTIPSRMSRPESQNPGSVMSIPIRFTSSSGRVEPPAARNSR